PARAEERELAWVNIGGQHAERGPRFAGGAGVVADAQRDGRHDHGPRRERPGALDVVNLAGQVLDHRRVVEGVDLRVVGVTDKRRRARVGPTAVDLGEEIARGGGEEVPRRVRLQY